MLIRNKDLESQAITLDVVNDKDIGTIDIRDFSGSIIWLKNPLSSDNYILILVGKHLNMNIDMWN